MKTMNLKRMHEAVMEVYDTVAQHWAGQWGFGLAKALLLLDSLGNRESWHVTPRAQNRVTG